MPTSDNIKDLQLKNKWLKIEIAANEKRIKELKKIKK